MFGISGVGWKINEAIKPMMNSAMVVKIPINTFVSGSDVACGGVFFILS